MKALLTLCVGATLALGSVQAVEFSLSTPAAKPLDDAFALQPQGLMKYDEGREQPLPAPISLLDGTLLQPNGEVVRPDGQRFSLELGQIITRAGELREAAPASQESTGSAAQPQ